MVTPTATALGRPSEELVRASVASTSVASRITSAQELVVASVTSTSGQELVATVTSISTFGSNRDTSAQVSSRNGICVSVAVAVTIMIVEGSLVGFFLPKALCKFTITGDVSVLVDVHMVLPHSLLSPLISGVFVILFVANRHRNIVGSKLHFWTLCYAVAAFALSWTDLLVALCRCNQEHPTLTYVLWRLKLVILFFAHEMRVWLSFLKLRCLKTIAPSLARVGELSWHGMRAGLALFLVLEIFVDEQRSEFLGALRLCAFVAGLVGALAFYGALAMVLFVSASSALNEASQSDVHDDFARRLKNSASWTRWTMIATAFAGCTFCATILSFSYRRKDMTARSVIVLHWVYVLDQLTNVVASALLSGVLFGGAGREYGTQNFRNVVTSVLSQKRRQIEQDLIKVMGSSAGSALTVAHLMDGADPIDVLREGESRFRCVTWEVLATRPDIIIGGGPLDVIGRGGDDLYSLSEPCDLGRCDFFVSHSWHDDGLQKWEALRSWCDDFVQVQGYQPRLWIDKLCICQTEIEADLRCLPVFLAGCERLLIISGPTYPTRLWCAMEVLVHRAILASDANRCPPELLLLGDDEQRKGLQQAWADFDVVQCNCVNRQDKHQFLRVVDRYPGGSTGFNRFIREFATEIPALSEASIPTDDYEFVVDI